MDEISSVQVIHESYIYIYLYDIHCRLLPIFTTCVPKESVQSARIKRLESRNVEPTTLAHRNGRKQTFTTLGQTVPRGKARPINHFTIPSDHRAFPRPSHAHRASAHPPRSSFPRTQVYENKPCPILPSPPIDLYSRRVVRPLTRHTHTARARGWRREGGGGAGRIRRKVVGCPRPVFEYLVDRDDREWIQEDYIDVPRRQIDRENAFVTRDDTWSPRYVNKHVIHSLVERNEYRGRYLRNVNSIEK